MKTVLVRIACVASTLVFASCASSSGNGGGLRPVSSIPPSVSKEGTIANPKLVEDATNALLSGLHIPESERSTINLLKFVIQQPVGPSGKKAWREMWIVMKDGKAGGQFILTFQEDGNGSADFRIEGQKR